VLADCQGRELAVAGSVSGAGIRLVPGRCRGLRIISEPGRIGFLGGPARLCLGMYPQRRGDL